MILPRYFPGGGNLVAKSHPTLVTPWAGARQAPLSLEWLPFPPPRDVPNPGIKPASPALRADSLPLSYFPKKREAPFLSWLHVKWDH